MFCSDTQGPTDPAQNGPQVVHLAFKVANLGPAARSKHTLGFGVALLAFLAFGAFGQEVLHLAKIMDEGKETNPKLKAGAVRLRWLVG